MRWARRRSRLIGEIFADCFVQVAVGIVAGCGPLAVRLFARSGSGEAMAKETVLLLAYGVAVMAVCAACVGPTLRALRVDLVMRRGTTCRRRG
ncbi:MAG: hypothetical protein R2724_10530 [Bryobacterales bacterium]